MNKKKIWKISRTIVFWVLGIWAGLIVVLQVLLSPSILTKLANNMAAEYVDADVAIGKIKFSTLRHFPNISLSVDDVCVSYPAERYACLQNGAFLLKAGTGAETDTLASLKNFSAAVNIPALLAGQIRIPYINVEAPRVYAKSFGDGAANWNIMKVAADSLKAAEDSTEIFESADSLDVEENGGGSFPFKIVLDKIRLSDGLALVYCSVPDSTYATVMLKDLSLRAGNQKFGGKKSKKTTQDDRAVAEEHPHLEDGVELNGTSPLLSETETGPGECATTLPEATLSSVEKVRGDVSAGAVEVVKSAKSAMRQYGHGAKLAFRMDSLLVAGRMGADTVAFRLDVLRLGGRGNRLSLKASAKANVAMRGLGRIAIPLEIQSKLSFPKVGKPGIKISGFKAEIADIPLYMDTELRFSGGSVGVKGDFGVDGCVVSDVLKYFNQTSFAPLLAQIQTNAVIDLSAKAKGKYNAADGSIPAFSASLSIPQSSLSYEPINSENILKLDVSASSANSGSLDVLLNELSLEGRGVTLGVTGSASDLLGRDPCFGVDASMNVSLDTLRPLLVENLGYVMGGSIAATFKGNVKQSQLSLSRIAEADLNAGVSTDSLFFISPADSIAMRMDSLVFELYSFENEHARNPGQDDRLLAASATLDSLNLRYKDSFDVRGKSIGLSALSDATLLNSDDSTAFFPFGGKLTMGLIAMKDANSQIVGLKDSENRFSLFPKKENTAVPVLKFDSKTAHIFYRGTPNRVIVKDLDMEATASMNSVERRQKAKALVDSLAKEHPDVPKDSLRFLLREGRKPMPEGLSTDDFKESDLDLRLDKAMAKYFMDWDLEGSFKLQKASLMTPQFPLRNSLDSFNATFTNNEVAVNSLRLSSGTSSLDVGVKLTNLRRALLGKGKIVLQADIYSEKLNANELLTAYAKGKDWVPLTSIDGSLSEDESEDEAYEKSFVTDELTDTTTSLAGTLIVIPSNIVADVTLRAGDISYSTLTIDTLSAGVKVQDRVAQISNARAESNVGNISFEAFYSTKTKDDISAGFDLGLEDITAGEVVNLIPAVDSLMPMITSFRGLLNCNMSATAEIDTLMTLKPASLNGVLRIKGQNLSLDDNEMVRKMVKMLMFKNKDDWQIDSMTVEGIVSDSKLEIFPFVMNVDRYSLALSGLQNLDSSFKYHISVIKSPLPFRLGLNVKGNFDKYKFGIGKAKYKSTDVPVFTSVVDETMVNLSESIHNIFQKGVDNAMKENAAQEAIRRKKEELGYVAAYEEEIEELSEEEQAELDSYSEEEETAGESAESEEAEPSGE